MKNKKIASLARLKKILTQDKKRKVVFTNGCFDILHVGHIKYLAQARQKGDLLVVGLNSDLSVKKIKGIDRPINTQNDRAEVLAALESVDFVVIFNEDTPLKLIEAIKPHVLVKGGDWKKDEIVGSAQVLSRGGKVFVIPYVKNRSTTGLIKKIQKNR
ncbi:MAG TPA: D-glycero-beta-D-manno-heptose 1-phosphate adenylyltransferase [Candidatus Omnitrophica bacterium]|nr:D-glycero-beta-D-manno-heptose 1-phosphate adenylyltransferase [Candidatus Omnitrophota bacterium]